MKKMITFDMDDTLTKSLTIADDEMISLFEKLSNKYKVGIITGGTFERINRQVVGNLDPKKANLNNIYLFPTCGTKMLFYKDNKFIEKYSEDLREDEVELITNTLNKAIIDLNLLPEKQYGKLISNRGSQISFASLGEDVPLDIKETWDPDFRKRLKIIDYVKDDLKDYSVLAGGRTTIDINRKGVDKAYAIKKIIKLLGIDKKEILFMGDALIEGGNDYPVKAFGVDTISVKNPDDTKKEIKKLI